MLPKAYESLQTSVRQLLSDLSVRRQQSSSSTGHGQPLNDDDDEEEEEHAFPPASEEESKDRIREAWSRDDHGDLPVEVVKAMLDAIARQAVMTTAYTEPITDSQWLFQAKMRDALDVVLSLFEVVANPSKLNLDPGALLIPILEDLIDVLTIDSWMHLFGWMETRAYRFTAGMIPSRGKALPLLKFLNTILRLTPKTSSYLEFRARIHLFIARWYKIFDPSGVNLRGEYATDLGQTLYDHEKPETVDVIQSEEGMEVDSPQDIGGTFEGNDAKSLYEALRFVQKTFANPPSIVTPPNTPSTTETPLQKFRRKAEIVLASIKKASQAGNETHKAKSSAQTQAKIEDGVQSDARYFVGRDVMQDVEDVTYRRQLCIQFLIFFRILQYVSSKSKPKDLQFPAAFVIDQEDVEWAAAKFAEVRSELARENTKIANFILNVIDREETYALWKHLSCFSFEKPRLPESDIIAAEESRQRLVAPLRPYIWSAGTKALSQLSRDPLTSVDQLKNFQLPESIESLKAKYDAEVMDEEDDIAMGKVNKNALGAHVENKASLSWRALRIASYDDAEVFTHVPNGDLPTLVSALEKKRQSTENPPPLDRSAVGTPMEDTPGPEGDKTEETGVPANDNELEASMTKLESGDTTEKSQQPEDEADVGLSTEKSQPTAQVSEEQASTTQEPTEQESTEQVPLGQASTEEATMEGGSTQVSTEQAPREETVEDASTERAATEKAAMEEVTLENSSKEKVAVENLPINQSPSQRDSIVYPSTDEVKDVDGDISMT